MSKHEKGTSKKKRVNRKNRFLCLIIAIELELIACICMSYGLTNICAERFQTAITQASVFNISCAMPVVSIPADAIVTVNEAEKELQALNAWTGPVLSKRKGVNNGPSGKETYYNLNMKGVVNIMRRMGNNDDYWVRDDGVKMLGDYVMVAANLSLRPRGSLIETSLGTAIVCDTGGFAKRNPTQIDIATTW